jgi:hypothetical protein
MSKDNAIKVEWQAADPPKLQNTAVPCDFPMNSRTAAPGMGVRREAAPRLNFGGKVLYRPLVSRAEDVRDKMVVEVNAAPVYRNEMAA